MAWVVQNAPPVLGPGAGEINLQGRSGQVVSIRIQQSGAFLNIAARSLWFLLPGYPTAAGTRIQLTAGGDATEQLLTLTDTLVGTLPLETPIPFAIRDESGPGPNYVLWSGVIRTFGYTGAP